VYHVVSSSYVLIDEIKYFFFLMIHKSHCKNDLINLINNIGVPVIHSHCHNKKDIQNLLEEFYSKDTKIEFKKNPYGICDARDLQIFLSKPNPKKNLSVKDKANIMKICKDIIHFCNNDYDVKHSNYETEKDIEDDILYVAQFGDLPSVRRACRLLNMRPSPNKYNPVISPQVQVELTEKDMIQKSKLKKLSVIRKKIIVSFD